MKDDVRKNLLALTKELMAAESCHPDTKAACERWLQALGSPLEAKANEQYVKDLEAAAMPIDGLIEFAGSETGKQVLGEQAEAVKKHAEELKASGGKYCDCAACSKVCEILEHRSDLLTL